MKKLLLSIMLLSFMPFTMAQSLGEVAEQVTQQMEGLSDEEYKEAVQDAIKRMEEDEDFKKAIEATLEENKLTMEDFENMSQEDMQVFEKVFKKL